MWNTKQDWSFCRIHQYTVYGAYAPESTSFFYHYTTIWYFSMRQNLDWRDTNFLRHTKLLVGSLKARTRVVNILSPKIPCTDSCRSRCLSNFHWLIVNWLIDWSDFFLCFVSSLGIFPYPPTSSSLFSCSCYHPPDQKPQFNWEQQLGGSLNNPSLAMSLRTVKVPVISSIEGTLEVKQWQSQWGIL